MRIRVGGKEFAFFFFTTPLHSVSRDITHECVPHPKLYCIPSVDCRGHRFTYSYTVHVIQTANSADLGTHAAWALIKD